MSPESVHLAIDVSVDGPEISGHAGDGLGPPAPFSGWLGLMAVLDVLLEVAPSPGVARSDARMCVGFSTSEDAEGFTVSDEVLDALRRYGATGPPVIWNVHQGRRQGTPPTTNHHRRTET